MANGPAGRKCCSARPSWSRSWRDRRDDAGLPASTSRSSRCRRARAASSARRRRRRPVARGPRAPSVKPSAPRRTARRRSASTAPTMRSTPAAEAAARSAPVTSSLKRHMRERLAVGIGEAHLLEPHRVSRRSVVDRHFDGSAAPRPAKRSRRRARSSSAREPGLSATVRNRAVAVAGRAVDQRDLQPNARRRASARWRRRARRRRRRRRRCRKRESGHARASCGRRRCGTSAATRCHAIVVLRPGCNLCQHVGHGASPSRDAPKDTRSGGKHG